MAVINQITGYYGFALNTTATDDSIDQQGQVNKCLFAIVYPYQNAGIDFEISKNEDDWGAQMGDGNIIPLANPEILYVNKDSAIVQFDMLASYPSNSPCILVYRSDTACFKINASNDNQMELKENHASGYFAFTTQGFGGTTDEQGRVSKVMATFAFPLQSSNIKFNITNDPSHWAIRMGDGSIIGLKNPEVISTNYECATVVFDMDEMYPSNSPCLVLYRSKDAHFSVVPDETVKIIPVTGMDNVPERIVSGISVDLSPVSIKPYNATKQSIEWSIISGDASVVGDKLIAGSFGTIVIRATVKGGGDDTLSTDFVKDFSIEVTQNEIIVSVQVPEKLDIINGTSDAELSVIASSVSEDIHYKWYSNTSPSNVGGKPISCIEPTYKIPSTLELGTYYFYCIISSPGAVSVTSRVAKVVVTAELEGIQLVSPKPSLKLEDVVQLEVKPIPETAKIQFITWSSSDSTIAQVDSNGLVTVVASGEVTITATTKSAKGTQCESTLTFDIAKFIAVEDILEVVSEIETDTNVNLSGTVIPDNSDYNEIEWSLVDPADTAATLKGNILNAPNTGTLVIRAMVRKGKSLYANYIKEFSINVVQKFIPVTDIELIGVPDEYRIDDPCNLGFKIIPENSSVRYASITIASAGTTGATLNGNALKTTASGIVTLTLTAVGGGVGKTNFTKTIQVPVKDKFIAVEGVIGIPTKWTYKDLDIDTFDLSVGEVAPANSTNKSISYRIKSDPGLGVTLEDKLLTIDHSKITWWVENPDAVDFEYYTDKYKLAITDSLVIEATVKDGKGTGIDSVIDIPISVESTPSLSIHIGLDSVSVIGPSIMRAKRPILNRFNKVPWNATNGAIHLSLSRLTTGQQGFSVAFRPIDQSHEYWEQNSHIEFGEDYDWELDEFYYYLFEDGVFKFEYSVENGTDDKRTFTSDEDIAILPEYIPVSGIDNIPESLPKNSSTLLFGEALTNFNVKKLSTEVYDVEVPSYKDISWSVADDGGTGVTINDGKISFKSSGVCKIKATIESGRSEEYDWYDKHIEERSYEQIFEIMVTSNESRHTIPVVTLTLDDETVVNVYKESELYNLSNDLPDSAEITAGDVTFKKNQVKEISFWKEVLVDADETVPITNIGFKDEVSEHWNGVNEKYELTKSIDENVTIGTRNTDDVPVLCSEIEDHKFHDNAQYYKLADAPIVLTANGEILQYASNPVVDNPEDTNPDNTGDEVTTPEDAGDEDTSTPVAVNVLEELGLGNYAVDLTNLPKLFTIEGITVTRISETAVMIEKNQDSESCYDEWIITDKGELLLLKIDPDNVDTIIKISLTGNVYTFNSDYSNNNIAEVYLNPNSYICNDQDNSTKVIVSTSSDNLKFESISLIDGELTITEDEEYCKSLMEAVNLKIPYCTYDKLSILPKLTIDNETSSILISILDGKDAIELNSIQIDLNTDETTIISQIQSVAINMDTATKEVTMLYGIFDDGEVATYFDMISGLMIQNYLIINENGVTILPEDSTKSFKDIDFSLIDNGTDSKTYIFESTADSKDMIIVSGVNEGCLAIEINVANGIGSNDQNYRDIKVFQIGEPVDPVVIGINPAYKKTGYTVFKSQTSSQYIDISANVIGLNIDAAEDNNIEWEVSGVNYPEYSGIKTGETRKYVGFRLIKVDTIESTSTGSTVKIAISKYETAGTDIKLTAKYEDKSVDIHIIILSKYKDSYEVTKLTNFARNFTNLTKLDRIPDQITGDNCLRNFLKGCTLFNQEITIPEYVEGKSCLEGFLSDCTSFNKSIVIPENVTGNKCLARFLSGCTSFNKSIVIPENVTGNYCLMRFLSGCKSFNQHIEIPENVAGRQCLDHFLFGCVTFNQDIEIPKYINGVANLRGFMRDTMKMTSTVTVSQTAADNMEGNGLTLACFVRDDAYDIGVKVAGDGASTFMNNLPNMVMLIPLRRLQSE